MKLLIRKNNMQKARGHKYIRRIPKPSGKGYDYVYKEGEGPGKKEVSKEKRSFFQKVLDFLSGTYGITEKKVTILYEASPVRSTITKEQYAAHVAEYLKHQEMYSKMFDRSRDAGGAREKGQKKLIVGRKQKKSAKKYNLSVIRSIHEQFIGSDLYGETKKVREIKTARQRLTQKAEKDYLPENLTRSLREHQSDFVNLAMEGFEKGNPSIMNMDGTGSGKTIQEIALAETYSKANPDKPVLIVTENERIIDTAFIPDAEKIGLNVEKITNETEMKPGKVYVTTYSRLNKFGKGKDVGLVVFDESQNMKNKSARTANSERLISKSDKNSLFSATPIDRIKQIDYIAKAFNIDNQQIKDQLTKDISGKPVSAEEQALRLEGFFDELTRKGMAIKREVSLDGVNLNLKQIDLTLEQRKRYQDAYNKMIKHGDGKNAGIAMLQMRGVLEEAKIDATIKSIEDGIKNGEKVVVFGSKVNDTDVSKGSLKEMAKILEDKGIKTTSIFGSNKNAKEEIADFQEGDTQVVLTTAQSGGAGISLDDTTGKKPRKMIVVTPPFSAMDFIQMLGRVNRLNTKSDANVEMFTTDTEIDDWNKDIISNKLRDLGAAVSGDYKGLSIDELEKMKNMDAAEVQKYIDKKMEKSDKVSNVPYVSKRRIKIPFNQNSPEPPRAGKSLILAKSPMMKAKYIKRWKGKDGAWNYQYSSSSKNNPKEMGSTTPDNYLVEIEYGGKKYKTGVPVKFKTLHNPEKNPVKDKTKFQMNIEPSGKYVNVHAGFTPPGWEEGSADLKNPLVIKWNKDKDGGYDEGSWKQYLYNKTGKKGKALTKYLQNKGFDGIVTVDGKSLSEVVLLGELKIVKSIFLRKSTNLKGKGDNHTLETIAKKHGVPFSQIKKEHDLGMITEMEHTQDKKAAHQITLDHLAENPLYYFKLKEAGLADELEKSKDLNYFKKKLMNELSENEESMNKSILMLKGRGLAVGTIRDWKGKPFKKMPDGKWKRYYTKGEGRGFNQAKKNVIKKVQNASTMSELVDIIMNNKERFRGTDGKPLPVIKELLTEARTTEAGKKEVLSKKDGAISKIKDQYQSSDSVTGDEDEIYVGKNKITGTWKMVEASAPSASHDEKTFNKTEGFPTNEDGSTINDRDYEKDKSAQESVISMSSDFDGRALNFDSPVVVTDDGVVVSGNNRTMSSKIAARKGTDKEYIASLEKRGKKFGFSKDDISQFKNPRVVFEVNNKEGYSTKQFAKFNESGMKTMSPIESAVKMSKVITPETIKGVSEKIADFDTLGELYSNKKASNEVFNTLEQGGIVTPFTRPQYVSEDGITGAGKEFLETVMIGSVVSEKNIRGLNREGAKNIRKKLTRAITQLVQNKSMGGYSISNELNNAIDISMQVKLNDKFSSIDDFANQSSLFEAKDDVAVELARKLDMKEKDFANFMQTMNTNLAPGASGQIDIFAGEAESKDDVLKRMLSLKKSIRLLIKRLSKAKYISKKNINGKWIYKYKEPSERQKKEQPLLAPNGKPSNLNAMQHKQVRSPEFKEWFGDWEKNPENASKVVDENGEPKVVYHGTVEKYNEFSAKENGAKTKDKASKNAFFFSDSPNTTTAYLYYDPSDLPEREEEKYREKLKELGSKYIKETKEGNKIAGSSLYSFNDGFNKKKLQVFMDKYENNQNISTMNESEIHNFMKDSVSIKGYPSGNTIVEAYVEEKINQYVQMETAMLMGKSPNIMPVYLSIKNMKDYDNKGNIATLGNISKQVMYAKNKKRNGGVIRNISDGGEKSDHYYLFDPKNIKSAIGNSGRFSLQTNDIRKSISDTDKKKVDEFLSEYKGSMKDSGLHKFAESLGLSPHKVEEYIYSIATASVSKSMNVKLMKKITTPPAEEDYSYPLQGIKRWEGLTFEIENKKGSCRSGEDSDGKPWKTFMNYDYGRIKNTKATDGESVDVYLGSNKESDMIYVVHQNDPVTRVYDEDKAMIGFNSKRDAINGYLSQYNRHGFLGSVSEFTIEEFKEALKNKRGNMLYRSPRQYRKLMVKRG